MTTPLGTSLAERYSIERELGRGTVIRAVVQILVGIVMWVVALSGRVETTPDHNRATVFLAMLFITGACLLGVSYVLLMRSPFRMSIGERLFPRLWLGPLGRTFLRMAIRP